MKGKKPTAQDVAALAGVSQSTVSMILNNKPNVSFAPETIERVYNAARQLDYKVKKAQTIALTKEEPVIAVVTPMLANPYYSSLVQSVENEASSRDFGVLVCNTYHDSDTESRYLDLFSRSAFAGIIYTFMPYHLERVKALSMSLPVVVVGDKNQSIDIDTVELNSVEAGELIARHLLNFGHKKMAFITTPLSKNNLPRMRRLEGVRSEVEAAGGELVVVESDKKLTTHKYQPNLEYHVGYELTKSVLKDRSITAYIGVNDMVAYGILDALEEAGLSVPEECSVCGFDNIFPSRFRRVALTTIDSFLMEKGEAAFELLARKISQEKESSNNGIYRIEYKPVLIARGSTGPCAP